ncbi:MAG: hypothetical protein JRF72_18820 [Deltaproteobacteria bacterium]|jgi:hypothetical protein|nr:hypothetical protein [Deltaproteobacteria bacterium]
MHYLRFITFLLLLAMVLPFTYGGCYATYGGSTTRHDDEDTQFTGIIVSNTSKATIDSRNAVPLSTAALSGGLRPQDPPNSDSDQTPGKFSQEASRILQLPLILADALRQIEPAPLLIYFNRSDLIRANGQFEGSCGGSYSYSLQLNRKTEIFSAWLAFENYCTAGLSIAGNTEIEGSFQPASGEFISATFYFENISDGAHSLEGEISMDFSDSPILANFNAYSTDEHDGQVYWIKDYSLNLFEFAGRVEIEVFGTFYHPDYGYVILTTSEPFILYDDDSRPAAGRMMIYGDQNTSAQFMAFDHLHYGIEADSAGDGIFDWDSGILNWTDTTSG